MREATYKTPLDSAKRWFLWHMARPIAVASSDVISTIELPSQGSFSHVLPINPGMNSSDLQKVLGDAILREDLDPVIGVDAVISANAWPHIERFVLEANTVTGVIIEHGCDCTRFDAVYERVAKYIRAHFRQSLEATLQKESPYPTLTWEYAHFNCYLQVINDKIVNLNPLYVDWDYFGSDLDGTFVFSSEKRFAVLPTTAVCMAKTAETLLRMIVYLQSDILKRRDTVALLNLPTTFARGK
jgi:hypothetical protein